MPIRIPDALPATEKLAQENIFVMTEFRAMHQDIRPLRVVLLNLMPTKVATETQIMRKLSNTPLQVGITLLRMASHDFRQGEDQGFQQHLSTFYRVFNDIADRHFDGMIITGAPVERLDFAQVDYWDELCAIMDWSQSHVHSTLHICWGAQAAIFYHYGIKKHELPQKVSGVFEHRLVKPTSPLVRGFDDRFWAPHSRYTEVRAEDIQKHRALELLAVSDQVGAYVAKSVNSRNFFVFGHPEYDRTTLKFEYERDLSRAGASCAPALPAHYFPDDNPTQAPESLWRAHAQLLYTNWLNYYVYQTTPYDVGLAGERVSATPSVPGSRLLGVRAENEDDDGYDPWSDRRERPALFQPDPWT